MVEITHLTSPVIPFLIAELGRDWAVGAGALSGHCGERAGNVVRAIRC
jgi:hypothetical protein